MTHASALTLALAALCGGGSDSTFAAWPAGPGHRLASWPRPAAAQVRRSPGKLRRLLNRAHRMPKHTKVVIGLCAAGIVLFFLGVWAKSRI